MITDLVAYALLVVAVPAVWTGQKIHDWRTRPVRGFTVNLLLAEYHLWAAVAIQRQTALPSSSGARTPEEPATGSTASRTAPVAGPKHRAVSPAPRRGSVTTTGVETRQPTPGHRSPPGVGPKHQSVVASALSRVSPPANDGPGRPVVATAPATTGASSRPAVVPPTLPLAGVLPHPGGEGGDAAAARPDLAAAATPGGRP
jgi:hypothetical protein